MRRSLVFALALCACASSRPRVRAVAPDDGRFVIRFDPFSAAPYYDLDSLRARVERSVASDFTITLRPDAIERFITGPNPALCVRLVLTAAGARRLRADAAAHREGSGRATGKLEDDLDLSIFVAELDGRRLFEGQVWFARGAAAFDTPAMHPVDTPAPASLLIMPNQGMWNALGPGGRSPIDHPALRAYFQARGAFEERRGCAME